MTAIGLLLKPEKAEVFFKDALGTKTKTGLSSTPPPLSEQQRIELRKLLQGRK